MRLKWLKAPPTTHPPDKLTMERHVLAFLILALPQICFAGVPTLVAKVDLESPITLIRVTPDGKRAVALVRSPTDRLSGLKVIDISVPETPITKGFFASPFGQLALAPNGRQALLLIELEKEKFDTATRHEIIAVDLSNPDEPKEQWRREVLARKVVLAKDASAYAASQPSTSKQGRWQTTIKWVNGARPETVLEESEWTYRRHYRSRIARGASRPMAPSR